MSSKSITKFEKLSEAEILRILAALVSLPQRDSLAPALNAKAYAIALEGISRATAQAAVKRILQGALDHVFFPNPVELRKVCEAVIGDEQREQMRRARQRWDDDQPSADYVPPTAEMKARVQALLKANGFRTWEDGKLVAGGTIVPPERKVPDYSRDSVEISPALRKSLDRAAQDALARARDYGPENPRDEGS